MSKDWNDITREGGSLPEDPVAAAEPMNDESAAGGALEYIDQPSISEVLPGAPVAAGVRLPRGYVLTRWAVLWVKLHPGTEMIDGSPFPVIRAPLVILGRVEDLTEGECALRIAWFWAGRWQSTVAPRFQLSQTQAIVQLANKDLPVNSNNAKTVVRYLAEFEAANIHVLPSARVSRQLGWQKDGALGFLAGTRLIRPGGREDVLDLEAMPADAWEADAVAFLAGSPGEAQVAAGIAQEGAFEAWRTAVALLAPFPRALIGLYAGLAPVLLGPLGASNFVIDWSNPTSTGKTTVLRVAASCWGNPDEEAPSSPIATWDSSRVWIERAAGIMCDLPLILDETQRVRRGDEISRTLYDVAQGRGRGRGSTTGTRAVRTWRTVLLSTGEQPVVSFSEHGGTRARVLTLAGAPFGADDAATGRIVDSLNRGLLANFGHAGPRFVRYVLERRSQWGAWRERFHALVDELTELSAGSGVARRVSTHLAVLEVTARIAHEALELPFEYPEVVRELRPALLAEAGDADRPLIALHYVLGWAAGNTHRFLGQGSSSHAPAQGWAGRWDEGERSISFLPFVLREVLTGAGHSDDATLRAWADRGWLDIDSDRRRLTKRIRLHKGSSGNAGRAHCHVLNAQAFATWIGCPHGGDGGGDAEKPDDCSLPF